MNITAAPKRGLNTQLSGNLEFMWLEITSQCNMKCIHCYAESGPDPAMPNVLTPKQYIDLITEAANLGCRKIQFIGGEPTLSRHLNDYIIHARNMKFEFIEIFTNLFSLNSHSIQFFKEQQVNLATSFYSFDPMVHDKITQRGGSHKASVENILKVIAAGIPLRVGIILMPDNESHLIETKEYLRSLGVQEIGSDKIRSIGRAANLGEESEHPLMDIQELCGSCWKGSICIAPDGTVSPCIMSKKWSTSSIIDSSLSKAFNSNEMYRLRNVIYENVWKPQESSASCNPDCSPTCLPGRACYPTSCSPNRNCQPDGCYPCSPY